MTTQFQYIQKKKAKRRIIHSLKQFLLAILYKASAELLLVQIQRIVDPIILNVHNCFSVTNDNRLGTDIISRGLSKK